MSEKELEKLEKEDQWDSESAEQRPPMKQPRLVVSVAFPSHEFSLVSSYADSIGKRTSQFIREAAIEKATGSNTVSYFYGTTGIGSSWIVHPIPTSTDTQEALISPIEPETALTY